MSGRKIVLFSDGTGNSASKVTKTNVWRLFQAIDLSDPHTHAFYDDGVGTGGVRIIKILGGAFGYGLSRNVRQLYEQLCRHYDAPGDEIYLCGFSRGAFTVRVLSGLIHTFGIIDRNSAQTIEIRRWHRLSKREVPLSTDEGLKAAVHQAYNTIRRESSKAKLWTMVNSVRRWFGAAPLDSDAFRARYGVKEEVRIKFLGVFDTVSAYGLPVDEMAIVIHKYLFPLRFPDMRLSPKVDNAVQALALDETRHTFHPVLWTEKFLNRKTGEYLFDDRPMQVWFPGVHADVGGGYADERLSLVPALWMADELHARTGLRLRNSAMADLRERATDVGALHDSRAGIGNFYRYKPRMLAQLGREDLDGNGNLEVEIETAKIHHSVFERIKQTGVDYAPLGIPENYEVVRQTRDSKGRVKIETLSADDAGYEDKAERSSRIEALQGVVDLIFCRKVLYYVMIGVAMILVVMPMLWLTDRAVTPTGIAATLVSLLAKVFDFLPVPGSERIGLFWVHHAGWFWTLVFIFALAYTLSGRFARAIQRRSQSAWGHLNNPPIPGLPPLRQLIKAWRSMTGGFHAWFTKKAFPVVMLLVLFVVLPAVPAFRWYLFTPLGGQSICSLTVGEKVNEVELPLKGLAFDTTETCLNTGIRLQEGYDYKVTITLDEPWRDGRVPRENGEGLGLPAGPEGLEWEDLTLKESVKMFSLALGRRYWSEDWMAMMGSIGRARDHGFTINATQVEGEEPVYEYTFHAWRSGRLFLFVNDAINTPLSTEWCEAGSFDADKPWACFYANNQGSATVAIELVGEP